MLCVCRYRYIKDIVWQNILALEKNQWFPNFVLVNASSVSNIAVYH